MNNMKTTCLTLLATCLLFATFNVKAVSWSTNPDIVIVEVHSSLRVVFDDKEGTGYVLYKECKTCKLQRLHLNSNTRAHENGVQVPLAKVAGRLGRDVSFRYNKVTSEIVSIDW